MDLLSGCLTVTMMIVLVFIIMKLYRQYRLLHYEVPARDIRKGHKWAMVDSFDQPAFCVIGQYRISHGARCDSCGVCVDDHNMKHANKAEKCKPVTESGDVTHHHWVQGGVPFDSKCYKCDEDCGYFRRTANFFCSWCHRTVHTKCLEYCHVERCDLGEFRTIIVPPTCVTLKWAGMKGRRHLVVASASEPHNIPAPNWSPLIVIANRKSGNNEGEFLLGAFRSFLNPSQVRYFKILEHYS